MGKMMLLKCLSALVLLIGIGQVGIAELSVNPRLLFVQTANSATLKPLTDKINQYQLTLYNVQPHLKYYSNETKRLTGLIGADIFSNKWNRKAEQFKHYQPQAAVKTILLTDIVDPDKDLPLKLRVRLTNPTYDPVTDEMHYTLTNLNNIEIPRKILHLKRTTIYIDGYVICGWIGVNCEL